LDLIENASTPPGNAPEYTVSELSGAVKRTIEGTFDHVRVRGEIGRVSRPRSGHLYLDLKDDRACLSGVVWRTQAQRLATPPEEGMEVIATGRLTTFPGQSKYQIVIETLEPAGVGALMAMLERRRQALAAEGLFAAERKRALPFLPGVVGVVTSPSGAVIRDILHRLRDRFPRRVLVWPVAVQGAACAPEVARAIAGFSRLAPGGAVPRPDVLIVARGGGSVEDLWGFNDEEVVRAAAACTIPLISAVGHETDTTLIDLAADRRAPTPTAAAEMAVPVRRELATRLDVEGARLLRALNSGVTRRGQRLRDLARALPRAEALVGGPRQRLDWASGRLAAAWSRATDSRRAALREAAAVLRPPTLRGRLSQDRRRLSTTGRRLSPELMRQAFRRRDERLTGLVRTLRRDAVLRVVVSGRRERLDRVGSRFTAALVETVIAGHRDWLAERGTRAAAAVQNRQEALRRHLAALDRVRESAGYAATLGRGYAVVWSGEHVVPDAVTARRAPSLTLQFADGRVEVGPRTPPRSPRKTRATPEQRKLL
jgi:exodeoxyribonuclease VII large subunit